MEGKKATLLGEENSFNSRVPEAAKNQTADLREEACEKCKGKALQK